MYITYVKLKNWRNFREAEVRLQRTSYIIGPNASGKSNFLDVLRFLRDVCKPEGGGLQKAVKMRGGISKLRCLHHRKDTEVKIEIHFADSFDAPEPLFKYILGFKSEGKGKQRLLVSSEEVWKGSKRLMARPDENDLSDSMLLTETHLEQTLTNRKFREIVDCLTDVDYLHLVPQLLKFGEQIGGNRLEDDPFGQGFLERLARCPERTRDARLKRIESALMIAVPQFSKLKYDPDEMGHPHLSALYAHHRPNAGWQREEHFSDGTLRLLALLWNLMEGSGILLLEEPELSLHQAIVEQIPAMLDRVQRGGKVRRQILISTHSSELLKNPAIDSKGVIVLVPGQEGTVIRPVNESEERGLEAGFTIAEVVLPQTRPGGIEQLGLWG